MIILNVIGLIVIHASFKVLKNSFLVSFNVAKISSPLNSKLINLGVALCLIILKEYANFMP